jgi:zinc D-Ala-D-Ala carboxypeptidase
MKLTPNFTLAELTFTNHRSLPNIPDEVQMANLKRLAVFLESVRVVLGQPILVDSAFRSSAVNKAVRGKPTSQHLQGCAADFRVPGMTPAQIVKKLVDAKLPFDQLILEPRWTHVSIPNTEDAIPRRTALIIDSTGPRNYA